MRRRRANYCTRRSVECFVTGRGSQRPKPIPLLRTSMEVINAAHVTVYAIDLRGTCTCETPNYIGNLERQREMLAIFPLGRRTPTSSGVFTIRSGAFHQFKNKSGQFYQVPTCCRTG
ncbi:unnamed protein product, partial [Nesidiocoris tenuis]